MYAKHSIKQKISVGMLLISVAMILAFMIVAISYSYQVLLQSAASTAIKELDFAKNNIDNLLSIIENYAVILATDETIQSRLSVSEPDAQTLSINAIALRNQINNIIGTFPRVNAVLLSDRFGNVFDSGVTILHPEEIYPAMQQTQGWQATAPAPYRISVPGSCVQPNAISFTQQINNYRTGAFCGYLTIYIDETYLRSAYSANQDSDQEIFLQSYDDRIISGHCTLYEASRWQSSGFSGSSGFQHYKDTYISYVDYPPLGCFFVYQVQRAKIESAIRQMELFMIMIGVCLIVITVLLSRSISAKLTRNISALASAMTQIHDGNWDVHLSVRSDDEVGVLSEKFDSMISAIRSTTDRLVSEQRQKRKMQLELLNQQINPHFLYNTLDNISALIELDYRKEAANLVNNFADFYRGVLSKGSLIIALRQELQIAESYLNIMQTRFHNAFTYSIQVPDALMDNTVLRLTLQPILENSITHGFETRTGGGIIEITAKQSADNVLLIVTDNGCGMSPEQVAQLFRDPVQPAHGGYAMKNIYDRIRLYYGADYGLAVQSSPGCGTKVVFCIPHKNWREK